MGRLGGYRLPHPEPGDRGRGVHDQWRTVRRIDEYGGDDRGDLCDHCADCDDGVVCRHGGKLDLGVFWRDQAHADLLYRLHAHNAGVAGVHARTDDSQLRQYVSGNTSREEFRQTAAEQARGELVLLFVEVESSV